MSIQLTMDLGERWSPRPKPNRRHLPIDAIFTQTFPLSCCMAAVAGFGYGVRSDGLVCPMADKISGHRVMFADCNFKNYNHELHRDFVRATRPKYATVRDIMTREQCAAAGIEHYDLEQILDWAAELAEYAEHVIVIPKFDCLDQIPPQYMLGYPDPRTLYGWTPLPLHAFAGRPVHLLGGDWRNQLKNLRCENVVSFDHNAASKLARMGQFYLPDGRQKSLRDLDIFEAPNPQYIAFALSIGNMGAKIHEMRGNTHE